MATAVACGSWQQSYTELVLKGDAIAAQIRERLAGTKGELHCDRIGRDGKAVPGCFLQLGPSLGDRRFEFSLPDRVKDLGYAGQITYRVDDITLCSLDVRSELGEFVIEAAFTSRDVGLKGSHSWLGDAAVPDIKLDHMRLKVYLKPTVTPAGSITYEQVRVRFVADVDNTFIPRFTVAGQTIDVMDTLTNYRHDLCASIQGQIQQALQEPARKEALAKKLQAGITEQIRGGGALLGLRFEGSDLIVRLRR